MTGAREVPRTQPEPAVARPPGVKGLGSGAELILLPQRLDPAPAPPDLVGDAVDAGTEELDRILRENRRYRLAVTRRSRRRRATPGFPSESTG